MHDVSTVGRITNRGRFGKRRSEYLTQKTICRELVESSPDRCLQCLLLQPGSTLCMLGAANVLKTDADELPAYSKRAQANRRKS